jgi:hypothetical protein
MAKASVKKPKLTPEEQMAELARLTGSVAAISHMGPSQPFVLPGAATGQEGTQPEPTDTAPLVAPVLPAQLVAVALTTVESTSQPATPAASITAIEAKEQKTSVASAPVATPAAEPVEDAQIEEDEVTPTPTAMEEPNSKPDFSSLFVDSSEKKTFQVRITASHQQFFQQMGLLLGGGASSTDVIHNILAQFRAANEVPIQKAFQRELRKMMSPKK